MLGIWSGVRGGVLARASTGRSFRQQENGCQCYKMHPEVLRPKVETMELLFLLRKLKVYGVNLHGLKRLYTSMIKSVLLYGSQAFYTLLSSKDQSRLESVQPE